MFDLSRVARWQNQKRAAVLAFVAASCTLLLCSLILSVPSIDDALTSRAGIPSVDHRQNGSHRGRKNQR